MKINKHDKITLRVKEIGKYFATHNTTVRNTAKIFGVSKSTVHKDLTERLPYIDNSLMSMVRQNLNNNFEEKHIRGGKSTQEKYQIAKL